ncbi:hypothetical protein RRG08_047139 [Elysia crispata]|uniref:Uncharacterized protein n=1 Tax=Elysia crispata TaxID=231223 RepID=A0AAE1AQ02_9GAST|nr:hypothetical protein RRG08_047139 [Elysia crispata]
MSCRLEIGGEHDGLLAEGRQNGVIEVFANIKDIVAIKELAKNKMESCCSMFSDTGNNTALEWDMNWTRPELGTLHHNPPLAALLD